MPRCRSAMSLVEVAIALVIFSTVLIITIESLTNVRRFVSNAAMEDTLIDEADRILATIGDDLSNSAWLIQVDPDDLAVLDSLANDPVYDRQTARYYPYIVVQDYETATSGDTIEVTIDGMPNDGGWYADFKRSANLIVTPDQLMARKPNLPPDHLGVSSEAIFLKVRRGPDNEDPALQELSWIDFSKDPVPLAEYNNLSRVRVMESLGLVPQVFTLGLNTSVTVTDVPLAWEVAPGAAWWDSTNSEFAQDELRHYTYALIPGEPYGTRLVRVYRNTASDPDGSVTADEYVGPLPVLEEVSRSVDRILFDTYRTASDLSLNQIRVRLWLSRPGDEDPLQPITHYAEAIFALRSTVDPEYSLRFTDYLGQAGAHGLGY